MIDKLHELGFLSAVFGDLEELWYYAFQTIEGLDFYFADNPVKAMLVRDLAHWQQESITYPHDDITSI